MTKRKDYHEPDENEIDASGNDISPTSEDTDFSPGVNPLDNPEVRAEYDLAFEGNQPTPEDLNAEYYNRQSHMMLSELQALASMPSWDLAMFQSRQTELLERQIEALEQTLQVVRTTTFDTQTTVHDFITAVLELCESLPPVVASVCMVKLTIRDNRPK